MSEQVLLGVISAVSGIVITYVTVRGKSWVTKHQEKPKDRMETIFDSYEKLIKQQWVDIDRKSTNVKQLDSIIQRLEDELANTKHLLDVTRKELEQSKEQNALLTKQLQSMKLEYNETSSH